MKWYLSSGNPAPLSLYRLWQGRCHKAQPQLRPSFLFLLCHLEAPDLGSTFQVPHSGLLAWTRSMARADSWLRTAFCPLQGISPALSSNRANPFSATFPSKPLLVKFPQRAAVSKSPHLN